MAHDQPISTPALYRNLGDLGITYKRLKRIAAERDDGFRADWLHNMTANYTAEHPWPQQRDCPRQLFHSQE
ncbi:uncharacterized protein F5147DRAFT_277742 [Suillus discolor]|uniref:Uncharacterized protein n=1 Tax=Suillus discolor TaxID=1912936 RepID=A0A9P7F3M5_9AGAM|nr:uncharacterized protein F5147DRAFT_277742 [Suillus discolor]KAG2103370.1 hypothetical protein F5147DRAFT_277742 [Suillus discolor]